MPFRHKIFLDEKLARVTAEPPVTIDDIRQSIRRLHAEAGFQPEFRVLVDLQPMKFQPSNDEIRIMASTLGQNAPYYRNRVALVVSGDLLFGLMRIAAAHGASKGMRISVFRDIEAARTWLEETAVVTADA